ncbi:unnamed protein product [Cuscuta campestris]|uniref:Metallo-beta-lactamase domain-containing protein n=1 Tax=Cuscuta campestris TaxID=132261 RepID=A0A484LU69_9ASTE|nr:unnamed protein product [Cuscuta campestris]
MATHTLVAIIKNPVNEAEFLLVKQTPPPKFNDPDYDSFADSDLWDLPSAHLLPLTPTSAAEVPFHANQCESDSFDFRKFDLSSALILVLGQLGFVGATKVEWRFHKCVEEPEFGPGLPTKIVYIIGILGCRNENLNGLSMWMNIERCRGMLIEVKPNEDRIGQFVTMGLLNSSTGSGNCKFSQTLNFQEYLPGFNLVPMESRTSKPFRTTNLIVLAPGKNIDGCSDDSFAAHGEALIVDPGCKSALYDELKEIVSALPRKLVVFVTHHHHDHVDGLSVVQKCNPDASLLAHENTMRRIKKGDWSLGYVSVSGSEEICIGGERLKIVSAPGHTDGHLALLHVSSNTLIVGDHCVGQGSSVLDITSGGHMGDYFQTTYKFLELSPHALIPMHGRVNMWPKHMLCGYLRNRRKRESTILKAMENGARTLFDIVAYTYADVDPGFWIHASSNVRLHVDHLAEQDKLPDNFSIHKFKKSFGLHFLLRLLWTYICSALPMKLQRMRSAFLYGALVAAVACLFVLLSKAKWHG